MLGEQKEILIAKNVKELAEAIGIPRELYYRYRKEPCAPTKNTNNTYNVPDWKAYLRKRAGITEPGEKPGKRELEVEGLEIKNQLQALKLKKEQSEVVEVAYIIEWIHENVGALKKNLLTLPNTIAPKLAGKETAEVHQILSKALNHTLEGNTLDFSHSKPAPPV